MQFQQHLNGVRINKGEGFTHKTVNQIKELSKDIGTRHSKMAMVLKCFKILTCIYLFVKKNSNIKWFDIKNRLIYLLFNYDL